MSQASSGHAAPGLSPLRSNPHVVQRLSCLPARARRSRRDAMTDAAKPVRTLFCFGVLPPFYDLDAAGRKAVFDTVLVLSLRVRIAVAG